ncbi:MAG: Nramp family divalent metal transporter [Planctomycetota bacterium]
MAVPDQESSSARNQPRQSKQSVLSRFGPGVLIAATGVGAGDLATAAFTGGELGTVILWAVVVGALMKFIVTEGIARWQVATGTPVLQGGLNKLGPIAQVIFGLYLVPWCFFVGAALISATGTAAQALVPISSDADTGKAIWGTAHAIAAAALVLTGGFKVFERAMAVCIGVMFVSVTVTAVMLAPDWLAIGRGLVVPAIPATDAGNGLTWTVALIGGVGGTLTVLCYGYWMAEHEGRSAHEGVDPRAAMHTSRLDLGVGYAATAIFGVAMVIIGSTVPPTGSGAGLIADLGSRVGEATGPAGRLIFLVGAWAAMVSSLLGVWQCVPMLGVEWLDSFRRAPKPATPTAKRRPYIVWLVLLATVPMLGLLLDFRSVQKYYAVFGATFVPLLALALLVLNGRRSWVGAHRNGWWTIAGLVLCIAFFAIAVVLEVQRRFG